MAVTHHGRDGSDTGQYFYPYRLLRNCFPKLTSLFPINDNSSHPSVYIHLCSVNFSNWETLEFSVKGMDERNNDGAIFQFYSLFLSQEIKLTGLPWHLPWHLIINLCFFDWWANTGQQTRNSLRGKAKRKQNACACHDKHLLKYDTLHPALNEQWHAI